MSLHQRTQINRVKRQLTNWEKVFANDNFWVNNGLISRIYKYSNFNSMNKGLEWTFLQRGYSNSQ